MSQDQDSHRDSSYFEARAVEERRMAMAASDANVRAVHLEMADRYAEAAKAVAAIPLQAREDPHRTG